MREVSPQAKFRIPDTYLAPNTCIGCGNTDTESGMVDLGKDIDWYGIAYLCGTCTLDAAELFDAITPQEYTSQKLALEDALEELAFLRRENLGLKKVVDGYRDMGSLVTGTFAASLINDVQDASGNTELLSGNESVIESPKSKEVTESPESAEGSDGSGISEINGGDEGSGNSEVNESINLEGSSNVRNDSSDKLSELLGTNS